MVESEEFEMEPIPSLRILKYVFYDQFQLQKQQEKLTDLQVLEKITNMLAQFSYPIVKEQKLLETTFTVFDLETTGFFPRLGDEVISIGAIKLNVSEMKFQEHFYEVVQPLGEVPEHILTLTGLDVKQINNGITFPEAFLKFLTFSKGSILVAHPASFDVHFLQVVAKRWGIKKFQPAFIDSYYIANFLEPKKNNRLDHLITQFGIDPVQRHHALNDAQMTATIFTYLLEELYNRGITTMEDFRKLHGKKKGSLL